MAKLPRAQAELFAIHHPRLALHLTVGCLCILHSNPYFSHPSTARWPSPLLEALGFAN